MRFIKILVLTLCLLSLNLATAYAAFKSSKDQEAKAVDPHTAWNPDPFKDDIVLPMPCGQKMVLRAVNVPSGALIRDKAFPMGIVNVEDYGRQLYEKQFTGHIAAPFTATQLPSQWQRSLGINPKTTSDTWYFIGKYEVSNMQWLSVMDALNSQGQEDAAQCPSNVPEGNLPAREISWFEVQEFLNRYNAWLVKTHPDSLPAFKGTQNIAFLRLPTEEEWEYAARGGARVPAEWWADNDVFPLEEGKKLADYGIYNVGTPLSKPAAIGSRQSNPLGIYDTTGNVREMVDGFFRLSIADMRNGQIERRLHGSAGGILVKGGGFRSSEIEVLPGSRDEVPLYTAQGPSRPNDLGFRVSLSALNIPDADRLKRLKNEETGLPLQNAKTSPDLNLSNKNTPQDIINALLKNAEGDIKTGLTRLKNMVDEQEEAQEQQNARTLEHSFRSLLYQAETMRAFAMRYAGSLAPLKKLEDLQKQELTPENRKKVAQAITRAKNDLKDYLKSLQMGANYYKLSLEALASAPVSEFGRLIAQSKKEYQGSGMFNEHMRDNIDSLETYVRQVRQKGATAVTSNQIIKGIVPESHLRVIPGFK